MKVIIINGQNHKGSTYHIGRILAEKLTVPDDITEIFLPKDMPHFCRGCTQCFMKSEILCPHYKIIHPLANQMDEADVLIFTSPVYVYHTTGSMKAFLDHFGYRWMVHRPNERMFQKQAVVIASAAGAGMKSTCKDIADSCFFWGIPKVYQFGIAVHATNWDQVPEKKYRKIERKTSRMAKAIKNKADHVKPFIKTRGFFYIMRMVQKSGWNPADTEYWRKKGWTKKKRPWK